MAKFAHKLNIFDADDLISTYSRAQAVADGMLIDVTATARESGFTIPVAITIGAWQMCVQWPEAEEAPRGAVQDEGGRLWDVLQVLRYTIKTNNTPPGEPLYFTTHCLQSDSGRLEGVTLSARCGPGDNAEPVMTICLPGED